MLIPPGWVPLPPPHPFFQCFVAAYNLFEGGGYAAVMGYDETTTNNVLDETIGQGWFDRQTRAVILEFAVFNFNTNLISIASYFYETIATGAAYTTKRVETLNLYSTESGALMFFLIGQFLFMAMVVFYFIVMLVHLYQQRLGFKSIWNMCDFFMITFSVASIEFYMNRAKSVFSNIKSIQASSHEIVHFHPPLSWKMRVLL